MTLTNYAAAVLDMNAGGATKRVMCYPISLLLLVARAGRGVQHAFAVDVAGTWYARESSPGYTEESEPCVWVALLDRDTGALRMERCPHVQRVLLLPAWNPSTPQLGFAPDADGRWIATEATW